MILHISDYTEAPPTLGRMRGMAFLFESNHLYLFMNQSCSVAARLFLALSRPRRVVACQPWIHC